MAESEDDLAEAAGEDVDAELRRVAKADAVIENVAIDADSNELATETLGPDAVRFRIFVIDTRWNSVASRVLHENLQLIRDLARDDELFLLNREVSVALLRHYPLQIGRDPIITVHDTRAKHRHVVHHTHGFRMHLGMLNSEEQVLSALQMFSRFILTHRAAEGLDGKIRQDLHRKGIAGAIEILGGHEHKHMIE